MYRLRKISKLPNIEISQSPCQEMSFESSKKQKKQNKMATETRLLYKENQIEH